jgi:pimeloyl-ACP methyl ester carboxylesterase
VNRDPRDVLLLVHGFPLDSRMWRAQAQDLADQRRVVTPDLDGRGGRRDQEAARSVDDMARQIARVLDEQDVQQADIGGFSMGGYVCFAFWRLFPARVRSLALIDTRAGADSEQGRQGRDALAAEVRERGAIAAADAMVVKLLSPSAPPALAEEVRAWILESPPETIVADLEALRDRPDSGPDLARISVPTLIVVGEGDVLTPPPESEAMVAAIPGARLVTIPGAGHLSPVERPAEVSEALHSFITAIG